MKLLHKFFLAFFVTNVVLVGLMLVLITVNFSTSFNDFVTQTETQDVANAKRQLITLYQQHDGWQIIASNVQIWRDIVDPKTKRPPKTNNKEPEEKNGKDLDQKPRPALKAFDQTADFLQTGRRLSLYNKSKHVIFGKKNIQNNYHIETILVDGEIVGWLGLMPSKAIADSPANEFLAQQYTTYFQITVAVILLASTMAFLLSKHLVAPIKQIIVGTNKLMEGKFASRINKVTQDELGTLSDNFNDLAHTLEQSQQKRFQWMSDTSHELRTPLTVLRSHLLAIQDGVFEADEKRIQLFIDQIDNLSTIVDDINQLSHSDTGSLTYKKTEVNVLEILRKSLDNFSLKFEEKFLSIDSNSLESLPSCIILGDKDRLIQLFSNLLENTCRYTKEGGQISIQAKIYSQKLKLTLKDSFPSVPVEQQPKLFERFYRVEKSRNRQLGGSGLGLSICKQIVEAHHGTINAGGSSLGGLKITIVFPIKSS